MGDKNSLERQDLYYIFVSLSAAGVLIAAQVVGIVVYILLLIPVLVVYPYQAAAESEDLAKGDKYAVVDLC